MRWVSANGCTLYGNIVMGAVGAGLVSAGAITAATAAAMTTGTAAAIATGVAAALGEAAVQKLAIATGIQSTDFSWLEAIETGVTAGSMGWIEAGNATGLEFASQVANTNQYYPSCIATIRNGSWYA